MSALAEALPDLELPAAGRMRRFLWELLRAKGVKSPRLHHQTENQHCRAIYRLTQTLYCGPYEPNELSMLSLIANRGFAVCLRKLAAV